LVRGQGHDVWRGQCDRAVSVLANDRRHCSWLCHAITGLWPDQWTWLGASIIIGAGLYIAITETRARKA
jgi:hypothetical protein